MHMQNAPAPFNPFKGIGEARPSAGGNYILTGKHRFEIKELKYIQPAGETTYAFIAEFVVVSSNNAEMQPGTTRSWYCALKHKSALGNIKAFMVAALGSMNGAPVNETDVTDDIVLGCCDDSQPLRGYQIDCEAFMIKTKVNKTDFTKCNWNYVKKAA